MEEKSTTMIFHITAVFLRQVETPTKAIEMLIRGLWNNNNTAFAA